MTAQGSEQAYNSVADVVNAIAADEVSYCNIPIEVAVAEAAQLAVVAREDKEALMAAGMPEKSIADLAILAEALGFAAAKYQMAIDTDPDAAAKWKAESPEGYDVRKYLLRFMSFAFRKDIYLTRQMEKIKDGRGHKDMVLDLLSLAILGEENMAMLAQMPMFNREMVAEARTLHTRLSELLAQSTIDPQAVNEAKDAFHRTWTLYKSLADEVKEYGQFLFEGTEQYNRYLSDYHQGIGHAGAEKSASNVSGIAN